MTVTTRSDLGDLCHFRNNSVPVAVITDLNSNIIASNEASSESGEYPWFVSGVRLMITRFWASASGYVVLSTSSMDSDVTEFPLDKLGIESEVCIWMGFIPYVRPVIPEDLGTHLLRCYVGSIDIVQSTSTATGGYTVTLQLRDRMKWLMDTIVSYNPALDENVGEQPLRSNLILEVAQRGIGQVESDGSGCAVCGKEILRDEDFYYDLGDFEKFGIEQAEAIGGLFNNGSPADNRLNGGSNSGQSRPTSSTDLVPNVRAWLDTIAHFEGTSTNSKSDNGYNVRFGGFIFDGYSRHPAILYRSGRYGSDASGRYQFLSTTYNPIARKLGLTDFSPRSQDLAAVDLIKSLGAYDDMVAGRVDSVLSKLRTTWASLPSPTQGALQSSYTPQQVRNFYNQRAAFYANNPTSTSPGTTANQAGQSILAGANPNPSNQGTLVGNDQATPAAPAAPQTPQRSRAEILESTKVPPPDAWYIGDGKTLGPLAGGTTTRNFKVPENPFFRIYTTRSAINLQQSTNFLINQQVPMEIIKFLAMQEIYPMEVFQDHRDGHLYYCPRANDSSGLEDPKRFYRTYFFRNYPDSYKLFDDKPDACPPDVNQMLHSFREEQASLDLKTNFIVSKNSDTTQAGSGDEWSIHLKVKPQALKGKKYACKFYKIYDQTITSVEEAAVVALNAARIRGKEVRAGTIVMHGDPSLVPGEVIQIIGSPLLPGKGMPNAYKDRNTYNEFNNNYNENFKVYAEESLLNAGVTGRGISTGQELVLPIYDGSEASIKVEEFSQSSMDNLICEDSSIIRPTEGKDTPVDPPTMYRVEALIMKFNVSGSGFTTEAALTIPF